MEEARSKLHARYRDVELGPLSTILSDVPSISQDVAAAIPPYAGAKQVQQFFQSGLVRPLKGASMRVRGTNHFVFYGPVFPRSSGSASHQVFVVWDGARIVDFACDCANGYESTGARNLSNPTSEHTKVPNSCIHAKVIVHCVAREQGNLTNGVWSTDAMVTGTDGIRRATKAGQKRVFEPVEPGEHYFKEETMIARQKKKEDKEAERIAAVAERDAKRAADAAAKLAQEQEQQRRRNAANARKLMVAARDGTDVYCVCGGESGGEMVKCSSCSDWFHFKCVKYKPGDGDRKNTRWYCSVCGPAIGTKKSK